MQVILKVKCNFKILKLKINMTVQAYPLSKGKVHTQNISSMSPTKVKDDMYIENPLRAQKSSKEMMPRWLLDIVTVNLR